MTRRAASRTTAGARAIPFGLVASLLVVFGTADAAEWRLRPYVGASEDYSDNIGLDPSGQTQDDFVTTLNGGASLRGTGARLQVNMDYNLQALHYAKGSSGDKLYNQLQATANTELVEQMVFLDLRGTVSQANISSSGRLDDTNIARTNNTTNVVTYSITPIVRHHFGSFAEAEGRYGYDSVDTRGNAGSGTTRRLTFNMNSGPRFTQLPWTLSANNNKIDNDSGTVTRFKNVEATGRYKFNSDYGVLASAGYEKNDYASSTTDNSGVIFSFGGIWTPTPRTEVEAGYRSRYFDPSFFFNASHRARRMVFTASYSEDLTTSSQRLLARDVVPLTDAFGDPVVDPLAGDGASVAISEPTLSEEVQVSKRMAASTSYRGRLTTGTLSVYSDDSTYQLSGDQEKTYGVSMNVSRRLSRRASVSVNGRWQRNNPAGASGDSNLWQFGGGFSYQLSPDISAFVDLRRLTRNGDTPDESYDENRATVRVNVNF